MNEKRTHLEAFVEQHRADFDAFEPRPDLWDSIEEELAAPATAAPDETEAPLRIIKLASEPAAPAKKAPWGGRYGIAAAVAMALLAGGGHLWKTSVTQQAASATWTSTSPAPYVTTAPTKEETNESFYFGTSPVATAAANAPSQRLNTAVQQMEAYFASQIRERAGELRHIEEETSNAPAADWQRELATLDSTYTQLKTELYRNPEPDLVLDAMNRNLQIRVDILNQQLRTRERIREYHAEEPVVAKNSRKR